jgi:hypothetical protein
MSQYFPPSESAELQDALEDVHALCRALMEGTVNLANPSRNLGRLVKEIRRSTEYVISECNEALAALEIIASQHPLAHEFPDGGPRPLSPHLDRSSSWPTSGPKRSAIKEQRGSPTRHRGAPGLIQPKSGASLLRLRTSSGRPRCYRTACTPEHH